MDTITGLFKSARRVSTPLIGVICPDPAASMAALMQVLPDKIPVVRWDSVVGLTGVGNFGQVALNQSIKKDDLEQTFDPAYALQQALNLPGGTVLFFQWGHEYLDEPRVKQAIWNLRDPFKASKRTFVLLAPDFRPPMGLAGDIVIMEEPLPTDPQIREIITMQYSCVKGLDAPSEMILRKGTEALRGLAAYTTEQAIAMSMTPEGLNIDLLWDMKRASIKNVPGLQMYSAKMHYKDLGGLDTIKAFHTRLFRGKKPPSSVVHIDEIEKLLGGSETDSSGTSQDQLAVLLSTMEDEGWSGSILVGAPGTGKTAIAMSTGPTHDVPTIKLDLGAMKGSLVGQSEAQVRNAMRTIKGIAGDGAYFVATCNSLDRLPPELRRRFRRGIWYVDLPTQDEIGAIWSINIRKYGLSEDQEIPTLAAYTGADVRNICDNAYSLGLTLMEAAQTIVPVSISDPDSINRLRELSNNKFLDASRPGVYRMENRAISLTAGRSYTFDENSA
jgi:hypothetical protein